MLLILSWAQDVDGLLDDLSGLDRDAQGAAVEALASALEHPEPSELIAEALRARAEEDDDMALRSAALQALGRRGDAASLEVLQELLTALPPSEGAQAVSALGATPRGRALAWARLERALKAADGGEPLVELLKVGAVSLVEGGRASWTSAELSPFARLERHPDPAVRRGVLVGINAALDVLEGSRDGRAMALLDAIEEAGFSSEPLSSTRADMGLLLGQTDPVEAAARALIDSASRDLDPMNPVRGLGYLGTARFIVGRYEEAASLFLEQRDLAESLARRPLNGRLNLQERELGARFVANAEASLALSLLADGTPASDASVLACLRRAHSAALTSHALGVRGDRGYFATLNILFSAQPKPWDVLGRPGTLRGLSPESAARLRADFLAGLATIAPEELPGISPLPGSRALSTAEDSERLALVRAILSAHEERLLRALREAQQRAWERSMLGERDEIAEAELESLRREFEALIERRRLSSKELIYAVRTPCSVALTLAASLRGRGETAEARALLESFFEDLEEGGLITQYGWAIELAAQAEAQLGSCLCDEDLPDEAERVFLRAVGRLEDLERTLASRGTPPGTYPSIRNQLSATLISLAVNANVRLRDPARALGYFERAYALRQDEFSTVLLACYRARSGQEVAAREALARVPPSPNLYYNLTCAHALLGDKARALTFLELELRVNHVTEGARERQRAWARDDPDLLSLREEARFQELTAER